MSGAFYALLLVGVAAWKMLSARVECLLASSGWDSLGDGNVVFVKLICRSGLV